MKPRPNNSRAHAGMAVMNNAFSINVGSPNLVDAAATISRVRHHIQPHTFSKLMPQRPRHSHGVLEKLIRKLKTKTQVRLETRRLDCQNPRLGF